MLEYDYVTWKARTEIARKVQIKPGQPLQAQQTTYQIKNNQSRRET